MNVRIEQGDCLGVIERLVEEGVTVDCVFTDPPYHLQSIVKRFGGEDAAPAKSGGRTGLYQRESRGFMGKQWDSGDIAFRPETWEMISRLLKPGGHMISFSHSTTYHRMACAIEDAGLEIRDQLDWIYGQGAPKSKNLTGELEGYGSGLKPAKEPAALARKPLSEKNIQENMMRHGVGALHIDALRVPIEDNDSAQGRWPANITHDGSDEVLAVFPDNAGMKSPVTGNEPSTLTSNIFNQFPSGRKGDEPRDGRGNAGRFFRTLAYGDLDDWLARAHYCPKTPSSQRVFRCSECGHRENVVTSICNGCGRRLKQNGAEGEFDAKILNHPTVKPVSLIEYWLQGICPPGGTVLDPFAGTGSTGVAAMKLGLNSILIDSDPDSIADIRYRISRISGADTPLFGGL